MRKRNWYTGQLVTEGQMDTSYTDVENAVWTLPADMGFYGVSDGHVVAEDSPASMDVIISGGTSYTPDGKRCFNVGDTTLDCSVDVDSISTSVVGVNSSKIISVFVVFDRTLLTPEYDATNQVVYTIEEEACSFEVVQGSEVTQPNPPVPPALRSDAVLLADITLISGQTTILTADISDERRQDFAVIVRKDGTRLPFAKYVEAMQGILDLYEDHIDGTADQHDANTVEITVNTAVDWADGNDWCTSSPIGVTDAIQTHIVAKLASTGATSGAHRLGIAESSYQSGASVPVLAAGPLFARLESMRDAANIYGGALTSWSGGDNATNPAAPITTQLVKITQDLARSQSLTDQGVRRIGFYGTGYSLPAWVALGATSLHSLLAGLAADTGTYDGASYVGAKESGALPEGTVRSQLSNLDGRVTTNATNITTNATNITNKIAVFSTDSDDNDAGGIPVATFSSSSYTNGPTLDVTGCLTGDKLVISATLLGDGDFTNVARTRVQVVRDHGGGSPSTQDNVSGAVVSLSQPASSSTWLQITMNGVVTVDRNGTARVYVVGKAFSDNLYVRCYSIVVMRIRP